MKNFYLLIFSLITSVTLAQTTIRVTNGQNLQNLINSNPAGTIFMVEPGVIRQGLTINKRVTIIGTGYFLSYGGQASPGSVIFDDIVIQYGGNNVKLTGIECGNIHIAADNVIIERCYTRGRIRVGYDGDWRATANNCMILQNYSERFEAITKTNQYPDSTISNILIKGNIFYRYGFHLQGAVTGEISNNTFMPGITINEGYHSILYSNLNYPYSNNCGTLNIKFTNNIMPRITGDCQISSYPTTDFNGNVFTQNFANLPSSNTINANPDALFLGYPTNPNNLALDARAQLSTNSVAKTAGVGGTEAGAFGGDMPYVLSGIPTVPNIYQLTVPTQVPANGTLNVQIKAKTNN